MAAESFFLSRKMSPDVCNYAVCRPQQDLQRKEPLMIGTSIETKAPLYLFESSNVRLLHMAGFKWHWDVSAERLFKYL